jgi:hypothetical protein
VFVTWRRENLNDDALVNLVYRDTRVGIRKGDGERNNLQQSLDELKKSPNEHPELVRGDAPLEELPKFRIILKHFLDGCACRSGRARIKGSLQLLQAVRGTRGDDRALPQRTARCPTDPRSPR